MTWRIQFSTGRTLRPGVGGSDDETAMKLMRRSICCIIALDALPVSERTLCGNQTKRRKIKFQKIVHDRFT